MGRKVVKLMAIFFTVEPFLAYHTRNHTVRCIRLIEIACDLLACYRGRR